MVYWQRKQWSAMTEETKKKKRQFHPYSTYLVLPVTHTFSRCGSHIAVLTKLNIVFQQNIFKKGKRLRNEHALKYYSDQLIRTRILCNSNGTTYK